MHLLDNAKLLAKIKRNLANAYTTSNTAKWTPNTIRILVRVKDL